MLPYWIANTLASLPAFLLMYGLIGVPLALLLLPREAWRRRAQVAALGIFTGAAAVTLWMFVLGMLGALTPALLWAGVLPGAGFVVVAVLLRARRSAPLPAFARVPLAWDERLLTALIGAALLVRGVVIAYWPFTAYDTLWVYGYLGRLFMLREAIPGSIGYYPPFLALQYSFGQMAFGAVDDHAARAGLLMLHLGTILAVVVLGDRLFGRRTGIYAAALWALYPHVGEWSRAGDLEIVLTGLFALAGAFFITAWRERSRRDAVLAGLMLGIGLWTKPTMGAFVWGMALFAVVELWRVRGSVRLAWPRLQMAMWTLAAAAPLGGLWYVRNALLGHEVVVLPSSFWLTLAARSGAEMGWPLLALLVVCAYAWFGPFEQRPPWRPLLAGLALIALGTLPSLIDPRRIAPLEWVSLAAGSALAVWALVVHARAAWDAPLRRQMAGVGWALLLAAPFFVTWFYSYSYHYRLSFPMVPFVVLPTALIAARWLPALTVRPAARASALVLALVLALPGVISAVPDVNAGWDYLWTDALPDDHARYTSGNAALMNVVDGLQVWREQNPGQALRVFAPGVLRLPFFFPEDDIRTQDTPTQLDALEGAPYFVYGMPETAGAYASIPADSNQVVNALGRTDIMRRAWGLDDGIFRYDVFELNLAARHAEPFINAPPDGRAELGGMIEYLGHDLGGLDLWPGRRLISHLYWRVLREIPQDYTVFIHLVAPDGTLVATWDGETAPSEYGAYRTTLWQPAEIISDERRLELPEGAPAEGQGYQLVIGMYEPQTGQRLPITLDGQPAGDSLVIEDRIQLLPAEPAS